MKMKHVKLEASLGNLLEGKDCKVSPLEEKVMSTRSRLQVMST